MCNIWNKGDGPLFLKKFILVAAQPTNNSLVQPEKKSLSNSHPFMFRILCANDIDTPLSLYDAATVAQELDGRANLHPS